MAGTKKQVTKAVASESDASSSESENEVVAKQPVKNVKKQVTKKAHESEVSDAESDASSQSDSDEHRVTKSSSKPTPSKSTKSSSSKDKDEDEDNVDNEDSEDKKKKDGLNAVTRKAGLRFNVSDFKRFMKDQSGLYSESKTSFVQGL